MIKPMYGLVLLVALLAACSPKPTDEALKAALAANMSEKLRSVSTLDQVQTEVTSDGDGVLAKFKGQLTSTQALYVPVEFAKVVPSVDAALFDALRNAVAALSAERRQQHLSEVERLTVKPVFLEQVVAQGATSDWYGSFKARKVVDKWVTSDFRTDVEPVFKGMPASAFTSTAIPIEKSAAWLADTRLQQTALLQRLSDAQRLEQTEAQLAQAQASAQQERQIRETVVSAVERQSRQMPVRVRFRKAALGNSLVLQMQVASPMTVRMDVTRGLQRFSRDLQLTPGRTIDFGHIEGWGFVPGDHVTLTNGAFDSLVFTTP